MNRHDRSRAGSLRHRSRRAHDCVVRDQVIPLRSQREQCPVKMTSMTKSPDHNEFALREIESLTTPHLADACIRVGIVVRCAPPSLRPVTTQVRFAGPAQPVQHTGSVDVILEALGQMPAGAVLVIDDDARTDRACIGDLTALEAQRSEARWS